MSEDPTPSKPCPFCGSESVAAVDLSVETERGHEDGFAIACSVCQGQGPTKDTLRQAIEGWNFRGHKVSEERMIMEIDIPENLSPDAPELCRVFVCWLSGHFAAYKIKTIDECNWPEIQRIAKTYFNVDLDTAGVFSVPKVLVPGWTDDAAPPRQ